MEEYTGHTIEPSATPQEISQSPEKKAERARDRAKAPKGLPSIEVEVDEDMKPLVLTGVSPLVEIYELTNLYEDNISGLKDKIIPIDAFLKNQIYTKNWQPIVKSYKKALAELEKYLNLDLEEYSNFQKIDSMYYYVKGKLNL